MMYICLKTTFATQFTQRVLWYYSKYNISNCWHWVVVHKGLDWRRVRPVALKRIGAWRKYDLSRFAAHSISQQWCFDISNILICRFDVDRIVAYRSPQHRFVFDISSRVKCYEGHRVKMKESRAKMVDNPYPRNVKLRSAITRFGPIKHRVMKFACSMKYSSLSRDRKWPRVTKCTHSRVVGLRLEGSLVAA